MQERKIRSWIGGDSAMFYIEFLICGLTVKLKDGIFITKLEINVNGKIIFRADENIMTLFYQLPELSLEEFMGITVDYPLFSPSCQLIVHTSEQTQLSDVQLCVKKIDNNNIVNSRIYSRPRIFYRSIVTDINFVGRDRPIADIFDYSRTWSFNMILGFYIWFEQNGKIVDIFDVVEYLEVDLSDIRCHITKESAGNLRYGEIRFIDLYGVVEKEPWKLETWYQLCQQFLFIGHHLIHYGVRAVFDGNSAGRIVMIFPDLNVTMFDGEKTIDVINH
jgi:hypothetical protein